MTKKHRARLSSTLLKMLLVIPALFSLTARLLALAQREIRMVRKKIIFLVAMTIASLVLLLSVWVCGNILLTLYLLSVNLSLMLSVTLILTLNTLLLIIVCLTMALVKVDLSLSETRRMVQSLLSDE